MNNISDDIIAGIITIFIIIWVISSLLSAGFNRLDSVNECIANGGVMVYTECRGENK